tara:strand:+ start:107 stop:679 length:573 start_codon:yes stop_codon:yes gene_type:complete
MTNTKIFSYDDVQTMLGNYSKVYEHPTTGLTQFIKIPSKKVQNMFVKIKKSFTNGKWYKESLEWQVDNPIKIPIQITSELNYHIGYFSTHTYEYEDNDIKLQLFPFDDGIMVHSLIVKKDKRGNGIGTEVMNKLYDISEAMEIPLYIIPFPAEDNFEQSKIYDVIAPLEKWYDSIGFGKLDKPGLLWCNY